MEYLCTIHVSITAIISQLSNSYKKYGVVVRGGITLSESGTARNSFASRASVSVMERIAAILPHR